MDARLTSRKLTLKKIESQRKSKSSTVLRRIQMKTCKCTLSAIAMSLLVCAVAYAADTASISGKVAFDGTPPKAKKIKTDADPQCAAMHADKPLMTSDVIVNTDGTLRNVFVYVKSGLPA